MVHARLVTSAFASAGFKETVNSAGSPPAVISSLAGVTVMDGSPASGSGFGLFASALSSTITFNVVSFVTSVSAALDWSVITAVTFTVAVPFVFAVNTALLVSSASALTSISSLPSVTSHATLFMEAFA